MFANFDAMDPNDSNRILLSGLLKLQESMTDTIIALNSQEDLFGGEI